MTVPNAYGPHVACVRSRCGLCAIDMAGETHQKRFFSDEDKAELTKAYEEGMNSARRDKIPQIQHLAKKLRRDEKEIKVDKGY